MSGSNNRRRTISNPSSALAGRNQGRVEITQQLMLSEIKSNKIVTVSQIKNQSVSLLEMLKHQQIQLGTKLEIKRRFE